MGDRPIKRITLKSREEDRNGRYRFISLLSGFESEYGIRWVLDGRVRGISVKWEDSNGDVHTTHIPRGSRDNPSPFYFNEYDEEERGGRDDRDDRDRDRGRGDRRSGRRDDRDDRDDRDRDDAGEERPKRKTAKKTAKKPARKAREEEREPEETANDVPPEDGDDIPF